MIKKILLLAFLIPFITFGQNGTFKGRVIDYATHEPVIGAYVYISKEYRAKAQLDGSFVIKDVPYGEYDVKVSMFSYDTLKVRINIDQPEVTENFKMGNTQEMEEVDVIGQLAVDRKTPVAVTQISAKQINEELGTRDLPMILNSTPGVQATRQGGGDGDARISIRGFNQRNIGVMIDGVPVNDMENGWVYWSNWFGLDQITNQIQVQRGLGATKLAMPSVGGTINIITQPTGGKRMIKVSQDVSSGNYFRTSLSYKSGRLKNGWGVLFSGSYKQGDGWAEGLYTRGAFYYLKVQKQAGKHLLSLSGFGAPQEHGQRTFNQPIQYWDADYARKLGVDVPEDAKNIDHGIRYNQHFGYYTDENGKRKTRSERRNYYHKPQITLKDFWKVNDKLSISNMAYISIGRGGGESLKNSGGIVYDKDGHVDWDQIIANNQEVTLFGSQVSTVDPSHDPNLLKSNQVLTSAVNNHMWIGGISQFDYKANDNWKISGGLDYRYYKGTHYIELRDLLGGDYWVNNFDQNQISDMKVEGDKVGWKTYHDHREALEQWLGAFGQVEYSKGRWSAFLNLSGVANGYKGIDYFKKKEAHLEDTTLYIGGSDVVKYDGTYYHPNSPGLEDNHTPWKWLLGYTAKVGANFNISERMNVFVNTGYLSRTPQYSNVINSDDNEFFVELLNEKILAFEVGWGFRSKKFSAHVNGYYTIWKNKPFPFGVSVPDPMDPTEFVKANLNGMDALHMGIEFDGVYKILPNLALEGMASIGSWTWQSAEEIDVLGQKYTFDATGVHVGDQAQNTYSAAIRYEPIKGLYLKIQYIYFDRYYSDFDPFSLTAGSGNGGRESWMIPSYGLLSAHAGYRFRFQKTSLMIKGSVFNLLDTEYISDAKNNQNGGGFDAASSGVFFGQGMTFNVGLGFEF